MGVREQKKLETAGRLLTAAAECFSEDGFSASSVGQIAKRAGVSHGTLYVHFSDKQALIEALVTQELCGAITALHAVQAKDGITALLDQLCRCIAEVGFPLDHRLWINILAEVPHNPPLAAIQTRLSKEMRTALRDAFIRVGALPHESSGESAMLLIYAMIDGLIAHKAAQPEFDLSAVLPLFRRNVQQILQTAKE